MKNAAVNRCFGHYLLDTLENVFLINGWLIRLCYDTR